MSERIRGNLDLLVLTILDGAPQHGYSIISELKRRSDGRFDLPEGTVYPSLHRLERRGLLESTWEPGGTRKRRVYRLTEAGGNRLSQERTEWSGFAAGVEAVLGWSPCLSTT